MSAHLIDITLPATPAAASAARRALGECVGAGELADDGRLALSEAVANAVEHTVSDRIRLVINHDAETGSLMCAVRDGHAELAPAADRTRTGCADQEGGRGLGIIAALSRSWGFSTFGHGKWLWFCLGAAPA
ncbi:ATP-binding protein [Streptomyces sp. NPDC051555]|uniref:ATP-binding protein n=1 Tax=Streptomyces sp. NPDC051555 TaxID=3365657 RepID=UPI00378F0642